MMKKTNIGIYYGTSYDRDTWKFKIIENFPLFCKVFVASRFEKIELKQQENVSIEYIYSNEIFKNKIISIEDMIEAEKYICFSFIHLLRSWYNWDTKIEKDEKELNKRFEAITKYVLFWKDFFIKNKIDFFVGVLESTYIEIVATEVAKKLNIPIINMNPGRISNTFMIYDDNFLPIYVNIADEDEKEKTWNILKEKYSVKKSVEGTQTISYIASYCKLSPKYLFEKIRKILKYYKNYRNDKLPDRYHTNPPLQLLINYIKHLFRRRYAKLKFKSIDYSKINFFFFPLHYADEATLSYQEPFTNQFRLIESIARCLPLNTKLIVKPHIHYQCMDIPLNEIKKISELRNVILVDPNTSPYDLISKSIGVLTINSTVGFEALILEKPLITFGHDFYALEGVSIVIHDLLELPKILMKVYTGDIKFDKEKIKKVVANYYKNLLFLEGTISAHYNITENDGKKIANAIMAAYNLKTNNLKK